MSTYNFSEKSELYVTNGNGNMGYILDVLQVCVMNNSGMSKKAQSRRRKSLGGRITSKIYNSVIVVCGGCYIGTKSEGYYSKYLTQINNLAKENNLKVLFLRGNGDDPSMFDGRTYDLENVAFIPDYSTVITQRHTCLCIGGGVSLERSWMKSKETMTNTKKYFENEAPVFKKDVLNRLVEEHKYNCVITNGSPSLAWPSMTIGEEWIEHDKTLEKDLAEERLVHDKVYVTLMEQKLKLDSWIYTKYNYRNSSTMNGIMFTSISKGDMEQVFSRVILESETADTMSITFDSSLFSRLSRTSVNIAEDQINGELGIQLNDPHLNDIMRDGIHYNEIEDADENDAQRNPFADLVARVGAPVIADAIGYGNNNPWR